MSEQNGVQTQTETKAPAANGGDLVIISDTTRKIMDVRKFLADSARSKDTPASQKFHMRRAVESLDRLIAEAVSG